MPNVQNQTGYRTGHAVQANEQALVPQNLVVIAPSVRQLCQSIRAPDQDCKVRHPQRRDEQVETTRVAQSRGFWVEVVAVAPDGDAVVCCEDAENHHGEDLEGETGDHDVVADF